MKKIRILWIVVCVLATFIFGPNVPKASATDTTVNNMKTTNEISFTSYCTGSTNREAYASDDGEMFSSISVKIQDVNTGVQIPAEIILMFNECKYTVETKGELVRYDDMNGYVGVFDGTIVINDVQEHLTVDLLYISNSENYAIVTIGCADETAPLITFYGEFTDQIGELSEENYVKVFSEANVEVCDTDIMPLVNAATDFKATGSATSGGYDTATVTVCFADELRNQGIMRVYAKINSHTENFKKYITETQGWGANDGLYACPDSYKVEIIGTEQNLHQAGDHFPDSNTTVDYLKVPVLVPGLGIVDWYAYTYTVSSTSVSCRGAANSAVHDNIITWNVYKSGGWSPSVMDGYYDSTGGSIVHVNYTYAGNVTSNRSTTLGAGGEVRYMYSYVNEYGVSVVQHMWSSYAACGASLTIVP